MPSPAFLQISRRERPRRTTRTRWLPLLAAALVAGHAEAGWTARPSQAASTMPVHFEANRGQTDGRVRFVGRGLDLLAFFTPSEAVLRFPRARGETRASSPEPDSVRLRFVGARGDSLLDGVGPLPGATHYLRGRERAGWVRNVPSYAEVLYRDLYPGIDVRFYGRGRQLEYDLIAAPGADPQTVRVAFVGATDLEVAEDGGLLVQLAKGRLHQQAPVVYQDVDGERTRVPARYVIERGREVRVEVDRYDSERALTIDPLLSYATYAGGSGSDFATDIAVDAEGSAYVSGTTDSVDFPSAMGAGGQAPGGSPGDAFVVKLDPAGASIVYATYIGGGLVDNGNGIAVDAAGSAYLTGETWSTDFPTANPVQPNLGGASDAFVAKLDPTGSDLVYATYFGGSDLDAGHDIALDGAASASILGRTLSPDLPVANARQPALAGAADAFVARLDASGSRLVFATYHGGSGSEIPLDDMGIATGAGIDVGPLGRITLCGGTDSSDFPTANAFQAMPGGAEDAFVSALEADGSALVHSTYLGGAGADIARSVKVDAWGNAFVTGGTGSLGFPTTPGSYQPAKNSLDDAFVVKLPASGGAITYSTFLGGNGGDDSGAAIAIDAVGAAFVAGQTRSVAFPLVDPVQPNYGGGAYDGFLAKLDPSGSTLQFSTFIGGSGDESPLPFRMGVAVDGPGNAYVAGTTSSTDFPTIAAVQGTNGGGFDAFVLKLRNAPGIDLDVTPDGSGNRIRVRIDNPGAAVRPVELKLWVDPNGSGQTKSFFASPVILPLPPTPPIDLIDTPLPPSLSFPGTVVSGSLVDPTTGALIDERVCSSSPCQ